MTMNFILFVAFLSKVVTFLYQTPFTALFIYTLYTLYREEPSVLHYAIIVLCVDIALTILGIILNIFTHITTLFLILFFILILLGFKCYSALILYSYLIEFKPTVSISA